MTSLISDGPHLSSQFSIEKTVKICMLSKFFVITLFITLQCVETRLSILFSGLFERICYKVGANKENFTSFKIVTTNCGRKLSQSTIFTKCDNYYKVRLNIPSFVEQPKRVIFEDLALCI